MIVPVPVQLAALAVWVLVVVCLVVREVRAYRRERSTTAAREHLAAAAGPPEFAIDISDISWRWPA